MLTTDFILYTLSQDSWFKTGKNSKKVPIINPSGQTIFVSESYYHNYDDDILSTVQIIVRVSNHKTYMDTWIRHRDNPEKSLQNLSVVFSNDLTSYERKTAPIIVKTLDGATSEQYTYFVVEQYHYKLDNLSRKDFFKFIKVIKSLNLNKVFSDPFKNKPNKMAGRSVITPTDINDMDIPSSTNVVHSRQTIVADNPDKEVDAAGNIIKENMRKIRLKNQNLKNIISETVHKYVLNETKKQNRKNSHADDIVGTMKSNFMVGKENTTE